MTMHEDGYDSARFRTEVFTLSVQNDLKYLEGFPLLKESLADTTFSLLFGLATAALSKWLFGLDQTHFFVVFAVASLVMVLSDVSARLQVHLVVLNRRLHELALATANFKPERK